MIKHSPMSAYSRFQINQFQINLYLNGFNFFFNIHKIYPIGYVCSFFKINTPERVLIYIFNIIFAPKRV